MKSLEQSCEEEELRHFTASYISVPSVVFFMNPLLYFITLWLISCWLCYVHVYLLPSEPHLFLSLVVWVEEEEEGLGVKVPGGKLT